MELDSCLRSGNWNMPVVRKSNFHGVRLSLVRMIMVLIGQDNKSSAPRFLPWDPSIAASKDFPITEYQPLYFVAKNLADAKVNMRRYCESLPRPFFARYNSLTDSIWVDRAVRPALEE